MMMGGKEKTDAFHTLVWTFELTAAWYGLLEFYLGLFLL